MTMEAPHNKKSERNGGTSAARGRVWGNFDFWSADLVIIGKNLFSELQNWISSVARFQDCRLFHRRNCRSAEMLGDIIVRNIRWQKMDDIDIHKERSDQFLENDREPQSACWRTQL